LHIAEMPTDGVGQFMLRDAAGSKNILGFKTKKSLWQQERCMFRGLSSGAEEEQREHTSTGPIAGWS
jgi:hypothetical protein